MGFGSILAGAGAIAGALGKDKQKAQATGGYATLPDDVKKAYEQTFLPGVMDWYDDPYYNVPMRRYDETDPMFKSRALSDVQQWSDAVGGLFSPYIDPATGQPVGGAGAGAGGNSPPQNMQNSNNEMLGRMVAQQLAGSGMKGNSRYISFLNNAKPADFAQLGERTSGAAPGNGRLAGGYVKDGQLVNYDDIILGLV